jgi:hypothetical protein
MERAQIRFETGRESGFLDAFVQLEEMRMAAADADPDDIRPAFGRERPEPGEGKEERFPLNRAEILPQLFFDMFRHVSEKTEG